MMTQNLIVYDFETGSKKAKTTQPLQLSACVIDVRRLSIVEGGVFNSYIRPMALTIEECEKLGVDPIEKEALEINGIDLEKIKDAPILEDVWKSFVDFNYRFNPSKRAWNGLIRSGYNIMNFDNKITDRLCEKYGPWDKTWDTQNLFHPTDNWDIMFDIMKWTQTEKITSNNSKSLDTVRKWMGINEDDSHNAINDVFVCAFILIKFMRLYRHVSSNVKFENSFTEENKAIAKLMTQYNIK